MCGAGQANVTCVERDKKLLPGSCYLCGAWQAAATCVWASAVATFGRPTQRMDTCVEPDGTRDPWSLQTEAGRDSSKFPEMKNDYRNRIIPVCSSH